MSFLQPLGLLGLLAIPIIVIIYILRSRYKTKNVSSTFIWKRSLKFVKRKIPLNFIMSLLLILQILTVVAASFAIARPTIKPLESNEKVVIIDASASMLTEDGGISRFEYAKQMVEKASNEISENNQITLIIAGQKVDTPAYRESDKGKLLTALQGITCSEGTADIASALAVARGVLDENTGAEIFFYTDKEYIETDGVQIVDCKRNAEWNAGIVSLIDNPDATGVEFVANIVNYGASSNCTVKLLVDGRLVAQTSVSFDEYDSKEVRFTHLTTDDENGEQLRVFISQPVVDYSEATVQLTANDSFPQDDSLTIYPSEKINPKILYISKYVVRTGSSATCEGSLLYRTIKSCRYTIDSKNMYSDIDEVGELKGFDLYIFEGIEPYEIPTDGAVWVLDTNKGPKGTGIVIESTEHKNEKVGFEFHKTLGTGEVISEITSNVYFDIPASLGTIKIPASVTHYNDITQMGEGFSELFYVNEEETVMVAGNMGSVRMIVSSFDFGASSLGAFVSDFPMLINNMVKFSLPNPLPERVCPVGSKVTFNLPAGATSASFNFNGELVSNIEMSALKYDIEVGKPGKYEVVVTYGDNDKKSYLLTGHVPEEESMIKQRIPSDALDVPETNNPDAHETFAPVEIFPYIIAVLIALLIIEWGVYYRDQY
ncbi:MAG: BatA and WFA domain-containing protein [Clostridia bacterium]|nr:BatA and WFA domain-containing protein [Clostridia bacterium]